MFKIYVGSTNQVKIAAVKKVAKGVEVVGLEVDSGVSKQPFSDLETIQGATNRALALPQDGLRIGLEAGVQMHNNRLYLVNWGVLIDEAQEVYVAGGTRLPLPEPVREALELHTDELATIIDRLYHTSDIKHHEGAIGLLTNGLVHRIDIFEHIVKLLLGQYQVKNGGMN